jgi:pimeloyl-ACP methyl ester carboxylesterase
MLDRLCSGDYSVLKPFLYQLWQPGSRSMGMRLSVWCSEEYPFENINNVTKANHSLPPAFAGMKMTAVPLSICSVWNVAKAPEEENQPFSTDVPVLILNGEYDPDTPATWGGDMKRRFSRSYHFVFKGMSHTPTQYWDNTCGMQMANAFFNEPNKLQEPSCFSKLNQVKFDTKKP